jgi:chloramphenicol 3-O phosphotransferase
MSIGLVLVLDGPSSVGKSTTVQALQARWATVQGAPLLEVGLDATRRALGDGGRARWSELIDRVEPSSVAGQPPLFRYGPLGRVLIGGMHRVAAEWSRAGVDVVIDHVILDVAMLSDLQAATEGLPLLIVGLTCDPVVLDDRESERSDVVPGRSAAQRSGVLEVAHAQVIDTTEATTAEVVAELLELIDAYRRG